MKILFFLSLVLGVTTGCSSHQLSEQASNSPATSIKRDPSSTVFGLDSKLLRVGHIASEGIAVLKDSSQRAATIMSPEGKENFLLSLVYDLSLLYEESFAASMPVFEKSLIPFRLVGVSRDELDTMTIVKIDDKQLVSRRLRISIKDYVKAEAAKEKNDPTVYRRLSNQVYKNWISMCSEEFGRALSSAGM